MSKREYRPRVWIRFPLDRDYLAMLRVYARLHRWNGSLSELCWRIVYDLLSEVVAELGTVDGVECLDPPGDRLPQVRVSARVLQRARQDAPSLK